MNSTSITLALIAIVIISTSGHGEDPPLLSILGKEIMLETVNLKIEPSEAAQKSIDEDYPDGRPAYWAECYHIGKMLRAIVPVIQNKFIDDNNLRPTEQDVADYIKRAETVFTSPDGSNVLDADDQQRMGAQATNDLIEWKYNVAVFEKYGGRIADTKYAIRPMDAIYSMLRDAETSGLFTIHDDELRALFWTCLTNVPVTYLSDEAGRNALYKHPADTFREMVVEIVNRTEARIKDSEEVPPGGRGEAPRP
jgi:hypothetical protein